MNRTKILKSFKHIALSSTLALSSMLLGGAAQATIVQFDTVLGPVNVNLYDEGTPLTVANFLAYTDAGAYTNSIFHRSETNFVLQGGGYEYTDNEVVTIESNASVINEPVYSNVRGTIAMAKLGGQPDSATSQWFFNLSDSNTFLDYDSASQGYTVFGQVADEASMAVLEEIAALPHNFGFASPFNNLPLRDYDSSSTEDPDETNFVIINQVIVIDAAVDTASNLNPALNPGPPEEPETSTSGGGAFGGLLMLLIGLFSLRKIKAETHH